MPRKTTKKVTGAEPYYTIAQVARKNFLGYKEQMIRRFIDEGKLNAVVVRMGGEKQAKIRIPESAIIEFQKKYTRPYSPKYKGKQGTHGKGGRRPSKKK